MGEGPSIQVESVWNRLARRLESGEPPEGGAAECLRRIDDVTRGLLTAEGLRQRLEKLRTSPRPPPVPWNPDGFVKVCERAPDFLRNPLTETQIQRSVERLLAGNYPSDFQLLQWGIDPDGAEQSTLEEPRVYAKASRKKGETLNTVNVLTVIPAPIDEAARLVVLEAERMGDRTSLIMDDLRIIEGTANLDGKPFTLSIGLDLPFIVGDRRFQMRVTAQKRGMKDKPGEMIEVHQEYVAGSGNLKTFDGTAKIWRLGPDRFFLHYELFVDLDTWVPDWVINRVQNYMFQQMAKELLAYVQRP